MRLFTAVELTDAARAAVSIVQQQALQGVQGSGRLRLVKPEHQHLTLIFIGEVAEERGVRITDAMGQDIP